MYEPYVSVLVKSEGLGPESYEPDEVGFSVTGTRSGDRIIPEDQICTMETGAPVLTEAVASLDCRMRLRQPMGDHEVIYGDVVTYRADPGVDALGFFRGRFVTLTSGEPES